MAKVNKNPEDRKKEIEEAKVETPKDKTMFGQKLDAPFKVPEGRK